MEPNKSPFESNRNPFEGIALREMEEAIKKTKVQDRLFDEKIKKLMKKWKPRRPVSIS